MPPPPPPPAKPKDAPESDFLPGQPLPTPHVVERDTDTAWALFQALQEGAPEAASDGFPTTARDPVDVQHRLPRRPAVRKQLAPITEEEVMFEARRNNRVCPLPSHWQKLHELLLQSGPDAPAPVSVASWRGTSSLDKRLTLRQQVEWAGVHAALDAVFAFLRGLPEDKWHHMGE